MSALLWVARDVRELDPLLAACDCLRQQIVLREAQRLRLEVLAQEEDGAQFYGVRGHHRILLALLQRLEGMGVSGLAVEASTDEAWQVLRASGLDFEFVRNDGVADR